MAEVEKCKPPDNSAVRAKRSSRQRRSDIHELLFRKGSEPRIKENEQLASLGSADALIRGWKPINVV